MLRAMDQEFVRNVESGDAEALVDAFYAEDAEVLPPHAAVAKGRAAILALWKGMLAAGLKVQVLNTTRIEESGDLAFGSGVYELTLSPPGVGTIADDGKYVVVYGRQADRSWKAVCDIFNSSRPAA
ncbi:MAG: DUF4440 domain-containing protein [Bryobacterales bacterium]|nr:DUF4440 domain-containing protein [Bryobacterales bacterium]